MNIEPRKKDRKPFLPYFTTLGWVMLVIIFILGILAGVELASMM